MRRSTARCSPARLTWPRPSATPRSPTGSEMTANAPAPCLRPLRLLRLLDPAAAGTPAGPDRRGGVPVTGDRAIRWRERRRSRRRVERLTQQLIWQSGYDVKTDAQEEF